MRTASAPLGRSLPVLLAVLIALPAAAAPTGGPGCERLARARVQKVMGSGITEIQLQVHAYRFTSATVDALGRQAGVPANWKEGDLNWEAAYALLHPELVAAMRAAGGRLTRWQETRIPPLLETEACAQQLASLETGAGALADRIEFAVSFRDTLAALETQVGIPPRLRKLVEAARSEVREELALAERRDLARSEPNLAAATQQNLAFGKVFIAAMRKAGNGDAEAEQKLMREAGAAMIERHREALGAILRRAAGPG